MKNLVALTAVAAVLTMQAPAANATLSLMVDGTTIADNSANDSNPNIGAITYNGTAAGFTTSVNTGTLSNLPSIDLSNVLVTSTGAGTLVIKLTDTGLTSPAGVQNWLTQFSGSVSGGSGSITAQTYIDPTNAPFGTGTALANLTASTTPFALSSVNAGGGATPFSLTEVITVISSGAGRNYSLDTQLSLVPEPGTLAVLGTALAGLGLLSRRRSKI